MERGPYETRRNDVLGRHLLAAREIKAGELVLKDAASMVGAPINSFLVCFKCAATIWRNFVPCSGCQVAPVCSKTCTGKLHPEGECEALKDRVKLRDLVENPQVTMPLRCLLMREHAGDAWEEFAQLEPHLEERRGTWIWRCHERNVEQILQEMGVLEQRDVEEEVVQRICGVLDVNSFEIRPAAEKMMLGASSPKHFLRGVFPKAALIAHNCTANTHLAVDDDFNLSVHASVPIAEGEIIYFNYSSSLLGSQERKEHLKQGKYFECNCKRCEDPTEMGTHLSSLKCVRCRSGKITPRGQGWACEGCQHPYSGSMIETAIKQCKHLVEDADPHDVEAGEALLKKLRGSLSEDHYIILELKQNLVAAYSAAIPSDEKLLRKIQLCEELQGVFETLEPGISRHQAVALYQIASTRSELAQRRYNEQEIGDEGFASELRLCEGLLKKAVGYLIIEPPNSPEGRLKSKALCDLRLLRTNIKQLSDSD